MANLDSACENRPVQIFGAIGQPVAFDNLLRFMFDDTFKCFSTKAPSLNRYKKFKFLFLSLAHYFKEVSCNVISRILN